jgi:hypothetical protein
VRISASQISVGCGSFATAESATNEKAGAELPHSKTDEYLERILLGLIGVVKGKDGRLGRRAIQKTEKRTGLKTGHYD